MDETIVENNKNQDRSRFATMTEDQKINVIWKLKVKHQQIETVMEKIARCHRSFNRNGESQNLFITGLSGLGKTTLCNFYLKRYPKIQNDADDIVPVLYARIPTPATIKMVASKLLEAIGDPFSEKGTTVLITKRLRNFIKACCVELIILDEFQHLSGTESKLYQAADWLKALIEDTNVPMVVIGLPESVGVLHTNSQLGRRFSHRCDLSPFSWQNHDDRINFARLLKSIDDNLPFIETSNLAVGNMISRIYYASDGVIGDVTKLIFNAAQNAVEQDSPNLKMGFLAQAFDDHIKHRKPGKKNPFITKNFFLSTRKTEAEVPNGLNGRIRPKKKKQGLEVLKS